VLAAGGCENTNTLVPSDATITVTANPATVVLDPDNPSAARDPQTGLLLATASILATVLNSDGYPLEAVQVFFSAGGGKLGTQGPPARRRRRSSPTRRRAHDTLTILETDPNSIVVTAFATSISGSVSVAKTLASCTNVAPVVDAGPDKSEDGDPDAPVAVALTGTATDDDNPDCDDCDLVATWDCGNGTSASGLSVTCYYDYADGDPDRATP